MTVFGVLTIAREPHMIYGSETVWSPHEERYSCCRCMFPAGVAHSVEVHGYASRIRLCVTVAHTSIQGRHRPAGYLGASVDQMMFVVDEVCVSALIWKHTGKKGSLITLDEEIHLLCARSYVWL